MQVGRRARSFGASSSYTPETINGIRVRAIESLGKKHSPEGLALLCQIAAAPAKRDVKPAASEVDALSSVNVGLDEFDVRMAALRSLGNYNGEITAAHALYRVMNTEHDTALKSRAYESLKRATGQSYEPSAPEWKQFLKLIDSAPAGVQPIQQVGARSPGE